MDDSDPEAPGGAVGETRALLDRINHLEHMLGDAASKIMRLEGTADQITDTEIGKKVESIRDAIQRWVNGVEQDLREQDKDFGRRFQRVLREDHGDSIPRRLGLFIDSGCDTDPEWMTWLSRLSTCIYVVLGRQIWAYIEEEILGCRYPVGAYRTLVDAFDDILDVMWCDGEAEGISCIPCYGEPPVDRAR